MEIIQSTAWRFYNKDDGTITYGLGQPSSTFESERFLAMNRLLAATTHGGELFAGDVVCLNGEPTRFLAFLDGRIESKDGEVRYISDADDYMVVGQLPLGW